MTRHVELTSAIKVKYPVEIFGAVQHFGLIRNRTEYPVHP